ncbi:MAG: hypothetical protein Q8L34_04870 [Candidatus Woesearchaeota archaeon]|nr:hypothetical protein [Candidatus Woesearchaeota archaeon]
MVEEQNQNKDRYKQITQRLTEMTANMTPEQMDKRWGIGMSTYLQNANDLFSYLSKEKRKVLQQKEKVSDVLYTQTGGLTFPELKRWYSEGTPTKKTEKQHREIVYRERMLELIAQKFGVEIQESRRRIQDRKISTKEDLKTELADSPNTRYMVGLCDGDDIDMADIIAVVYDGRITRDDAIRFLQDSALRDYLGKINKGPGGDPIDIDIYAPKLLQLDKNGVIASIVYKRLVENRRKELGAKPTLEQCAAYRERLKKKLEEII